MSSHKRRQADQAGIRRSTQALRAWRSRVLRTLERLVLSTLRGVIRMAFRLSYGLRVEGVERIPRNGGALIVSNHLSYIDSLLIAASVPRPVRFVMYDGHHRRIWLRPVAALSRAIPLSSEMGPREMLGALRVAAGAVRRGELVCLFAEGQISRIGHLLPFGRGLEHMMRGVAAPIIPVALDNVWGSVFSLSHARFSWRDPLRRYGPMTVLFGSPLPGSSKSHEVRQAVAALLTDAWNRRKRHARSLGEALIRAARRSPFRLAMADSRTGALRFGSALSRAILLARRLEPFLSRQDRVGVLLPPSVAAALTNHALLLLGKIPVNLNYTLDNEALLSCIRQCDLEYVLTSRAVIERLRLELPMNHLFLEDFVLDVGAREKATAVFAAAVLPVPALRRWLGARNARPDDTATVMFSSGSTGDPKGIELSHWNIIANVWQLGHVFPLKGSDRMLGALPFFHSFGFTVTYALPALLGVGALYHPNPTEAGVIGKLARRYSATFLPSTPTFLAHYARRIPAASFGSLRFVLAGAEKLTDAVINDFEDRFGLRPREGYGCTECAPVVCASAGDFRAAGMRQAGARRHSVGHPLPGISVRIVDPETMKALPHGRPGLLLIRGPNVMRRYLGRPELTAAIFHEGYYVTGDVATLDSSGFVEITDRLSRFAKIGGEMVPLIRVEESLHALMGARERTFAVSSVPDARKGERLAVLHTLTTNALRDVLAGLPASKLPRLWMPRPNDFIRVDSIPCLGGGKLDLARVREIAASARQ